MKIGNVSEIVRSKYRNRKVKGFDSAKEWRRNQELEIMQRVGEISELNRQVPFVLMPSYTIADETTKQGFRTIREIRYIAGNANGRFQDKAKTAREKNSPWSDRGRV